MVWTSGMALNFPNFSRSYDAAGNRIRFWGHDGAIEYLIQFLREHRERQRLITKRDSAIVA